MTSAHNNIRENSKCFAYFFQQSHFEKFVRAHVNVKRQSAWTRYIICHWIYYYSAAYVLCNVCDVIMCQCGMCLSYGRLFRTLAGNFQVQKWNANLCPKALSQCEHCTPNNDGLDLTEVWDKARSNTNTNTRTNEMCGNQGISKLKSQLSVNRKKKNLTFIPFHSIAVLRSSLFIN